MSEETAKRTLPVKHDWYQTDADVVITILVKNVKEDEFKVSFSDTQVKINLNIPDYEECFQCFSLSHKIVPGQCTYKLTPSKIEIKLKKTEGLRWNQLEGQIVEDNIKAIPQTSNTQTDHPPAYPTSKKGIDWSKVERDIKKQEQEEKPEGEEALNKLFQDIYGKGTDEVRKAMNKSFMESGGTVLSTNWNEVSQKKVTVNPPDGMEYKKWDS